MNQYLSAPEHDAVSNSRAQLDAPELPTAATNAPYEFAQMASALTTISQQVLDVSDSPERAVRTILAQALALVHAPAGVIVVAPRGQAPEFIHCQGLSDAARTRELICAHWESESRIYRDKGDRWYCALDSVPDTLPHVGAWARSEGVGAILSAPLWLSERLVGHLSLLHTAPHRWTDVEVQTARLLAGQAAIAVDRVLLARRLRERLGQAEVLNRVFQAASSVLDPADILQNVCAEPPRREVVYTTRYVEAPTVVREVQYVQPQVQYVQPKVVIPESTITIWVRNSNDSQTPVTLRRASGGRYIGPRGEYYDGLPGNESLRALYGM